MSGQGSDPVRRAGDTAPGSPWLPAIDGCRPNHCSSLKITLLLLLKASYSSKIFKNFPRDSKIKEAFIKVALDMKSV
jgi:hypothetical protein